MINFKVSEDGRIILDGQNNISVVSGQDEFTQAVEEILKTNAGEWFLDPDHGLDRFEILGKKVDAEHATDILRAAIFQEPRVDRIEKLELEFEKINRKLIVKFEIIQTTGETVEGEAVV